MSAKNLFKEILPSILVNSRVEVTEENKSDYVPFVINRALSFHFDCLLAANEMNQLHVLDPVLQYNFYLYSLRKYKRPFKKWFKREKNENLVAVKKYYNLSTSHAKEALLCLTSEQLDEIRKETEVEEKTCST